MLCLKRAQEFLIARPKKLKKTYSESHCPDIFKELRFDTVAENCKYFTSFNGWPFLKHLRKK